jgi:hypothetical protein
MTVADELKRKIEAAPMARTEFISKRIPGNQRSRSLITSS